MMNTKINKSDLIILSLFYLVSFTMQGVSYYERSAFLREYVFDFPAEIITTCAIIYLFIFWLIPKFLISKKYILSTIYALIILIFFASIEHLIGFWSGKNDWSRFPKGMDYIFDMIDRATTNTGFPFAILLTKKFYEGQTAFLKIEKQQKENELKLLRSQIDPHFLFNNLNTLDSLIDSNPEKAKEYINRLSLIYRYLIQTKDSEVMELSEEINFTRNYIFLIKTRFEDDYEFSIEQKTNLTDKFIPTGALQTLIENVIKHNKNDAFAIKTKIIINEDTLQIINNKSGLKSKNESFGTGLENLRIRYKHLSNQEVVILNKEKEYKVSIPIIKLSE